MITFRDASNRSSISLLFVTVNDDTLLSQATLPAPGSLINLQYPLQNDKLSDLEVFHFNSCWRLVHLPVLHITDISSISSPTNTCSSHVNICAKKPAMVWDSPIGIPKI